VNITNNQKLSCAKVSFERYTVVFCRSKSFKTFAYFGRKYRGGGL